MLFLLMFFAVSCEASVRTDGLNDWLSLGAERSLNAVYEHIPAGETNETKERLLTVVADRLLSGYMVESVVFTGEGDVSLKLAVRSKPP